MKIKYFSQGFHPPCTFPSIIYIKPTYLSTCLPFYVSLLLHFSTSSPFPLYSIVLKLVNHPNIIRMEGLYESKQYLYIVMEMLTGGELFERIVGRPRYIFILPSVCLSFCLPVYSLFRPFVYPSTWHVPLLHPHGIFYTLLRPYFLSIHPYIR